MWLENFNRLRKRSGLSLDELSRLSGVPKGTLAKITSGATRSPAIETVMSLVHTMGYNLGELDDFGRDEPAFSEEERESVKKYRGLDVHGKRAVDGVLSVEYDRVTHIFEKDERHGMTYILLYDLAASAGTGEPLGDSEYNTCLQIPTDHLPQDAHFCVRISGNSMEPAYKDGDIVFVQHTEGSVREGEIGIFVLNGEGYIKRLGDGELLSTNPAYPPIRIRDGDDLRCQGRVLGKLQTDLKKLP